MASRHPIFGEAVASGYLTLAFIRRLMLDQHLGFAWGIIDQGIDRVRWRRPVKSCDSVLVRGRIDEIVRDAGPAGALIVDLEVVNQDAQTVMTMRIRSIVPSREVLRAMTAQRPEAGGSVADASALK